MFGPEYTKINTLFKRDERKVIMPNEFSEDVFAFLRPCLWVWTEKVDGTNVRVHWDGEKLTFGGRTDNAQMPTFLLEVLQEDFKPELFAETFGSSDVTIYGEGYGPKIQKGAHYSDMHHFIMFDIRIGDWFLERENMENIAIKFGIDVVPIVYKATIDEAITDVAGGYLESRWRGARIEGLVGKPSVELKTRRGERIITKIKVKDFEDLRRRGG